MKLSKREQAIIEECKNADEAELRQLVAKLAEELEQQPDQRLAKAIDRLAEAIENQPRPLVIPAPYPVPIHPYKITWQPDTYIAPYDPNIRVRFSGVVTNLEDCRSIASGNTIISGNAQ